jgi:hypothetical protein
MRNKKKIIFTIALALMFLPIPINALYGGETINYTFANCQNLTVNITNSQMKEWSASPNCTEETAGNFNCNCSDNWTLYLTPATNAVGNYTITMTNGFYAETQNVVVSYGGGGGGIPTTTTTIKATTTTSTTVPVATTTIPITSTTVPTTTTTTIPATNPITGFATFVSSTSGISLLLSVIIVTALGFVFYKKWYVKKKSD